MDKKEMMNVISAGVSGEMVKISLRRAIKSAKNSRDEKTLALANLSKITT